MDSDSHGVLLYPACGRGNGGGSGKMAPDAGNVQGIGHDHVRGDGVERPLEVLPAIDFGLARPVVGGGRAGAVPGEAPLAVTRPGVRRAVDNPAASELVVAAE